MPALREKVWRLAQEVRREQGTILGTSKFSTTNPILFGEATLSGLSMAKRTVLKQR